jgi:hypothetical protein
LKGFPLSPDDSYATIQRDDPEDVDEDARALVERLGMLNVSGGFREAFGEVPLTTPRDFSEILITTLREMVLWLEWMRQHQPDSVQRSDA